MIDISERYSMTLTFVKDADESTRSSAVNLAQDFAFILRQKFDGEITVSDLSSSEIAFLRIRADEYKDLKKIRKYLKREGIID